MDGSKGLATERADYELDRHTGAKVIESVVCRGDLSQLGPADRARFYVQMCEGLGLNPHSQPFAFLRLNGKEILYATRGATDQLAAMHRVTRKIIDGPKVVDLGGTKVVWCTAEASMPNGRTETSIATLPFVDPVNVMMKAETKAKRRVTISILGLGMLDETELETIPPGVQEPGGGVDLALAGRPSGAPAEPAPVDALDAFRKVVAECGDLATIAAAYKGAGLGGTSAKDVSAVVLARTKALGYHLSAADVTALLGGSMPAATVLAYDRLACVERHADDEDGDGVVAQVVRVLRDVGGLDAPTRVKTSAVATCTALDVADAAARIKRDLGPQPPTDGGPSGTRAPAAPSSADATAAPLPSTAANDAPQASAGPRVVLDADETEARYLRDDAIGAEAWAAHLTACAAIFAMAGSHTKRAEAFRAAGVLATRRAQTLDAIEAREGRGPEAALQCLDGYRTRRVIPLGASVRARSHREIAAARTGTDG